MKSLIAIVLLVAVPGCSAWKVRAEVYARASDVQDSAVENLRATAVNYLFRLTASKIAAVLAEEDGDVLRAKLPLAEQTHYQGRDLAAIQTALCETYLAAAQRALVDLREPDEKAGDADGIEDWYVEYIRASDMLDDTALRTILKDRGWLGDLEKLMQEYGYGIPTEPTAETAPTTQPVSVSPAEIDAAKRPLKARYAAAESGVKELIWVPGVGTVERP